MDITLVIGNYNYSSWSLRAWLALRKARVDFDVVRLPLDTPEFHARIPRHSPTGRVPVLHHGDTSVWDSLAIGEYINEALADGALLPTARRPRALARAVIAEMHSGFAALRAAMPMNIRARRIVSMNDDILADIARVDAIWRDCRGRFGADGPWLFGRYSLADAFYAPVTSRFATYDVRLSATAQRYRDAVLGDPDFAAWAGHARSEREIVDADEAGKPLPA